MNNSISVSTPQETASILIIGGTDPSGAGLQADLRVVHALGIHAYSVTSAVTAQHNTGISDLGVLNAAHVKAQLMSVKKALGNSDSRPLAAIKIGMLGDESVISAVCEGIELLREQGHAPRIIIDPVIVASSGVRLLTADSEIALMSKLFPLADVIAPNLDELALLTQMSVDTTHDLERAAHCLLASGARSILLKGGHFDTESEQSSDYFSSDSLNFWLIGKRWPDRANVRGTGCLFATAIACASAQGYSIADAIVLAKTVVSRGIRQAESIGGAYQSRLGEMNPHDWSVDYQDFPLMTPEAPDAKRR